MTSDNSSGPEDALKGQRMMILAFSLATLIPVIWMLMTASNAVTAVPGEQTVQLSSFLIGWGMAAPPVWLVATFIALKKINDGDADSAKLFPLIPAAWAVVWFVVQAMG